MNRPIFTLFNLPSLSSTYTCHCTAPQLFLVVFTIWERVAAPICSTTFKISRLMGASAVAFFILAIIGTIGAANNSLLLLKMWLSPAAAAMPVATAMTGASGRVLAWGESAEEAQRKSTLRF